MMPSLIKRISGKSSEPSDSFQDESNSPSLQLSLPAPYHNTWVSPTASNNDGTCTSPNTATAATKRFFGARSISSTSKSWSHTPRVRYNRTPVRFAVAGEWALKECEEQTTWANGILKSAKLPLIVDIRKSIGDGTTLVSLTEIACDTGNIRVDGVNPEITCKSDRVENLDKCLVKLKSVGVDTAGIDAEDLADGNLKSTLLLVGNIRQHFDKNNTKTENEGSQRDLTGDEYILTREINMPGAVTTPGGAANSKFGNKDGTGIVQRRFHYSTEDILPGTLGKDDKSTPIRMAAPVGTLVSMTEMSANGVSQYGVEERRQQITLPASRGQQLARTQNVRPMVPSPKPPSTTTNAWSTEKQQTSQAPAKDGLSIEERLKSLINSPPSSAVDDEPPVKQQQFNDGELFHVPHPTNNGGPDLNQRANMNSPYGGRQGPSYMGQGSQHGSHGNIYVPSKPTDRWQGSRAEAILDRSYEKSGYRYVPGGHDNPGFDTDGLHDNPNIVKQANGKGVELEMRNAWNRLYGKSTYPDQRPVSQPSVSMMRDQHGISHTQSKLNQYPSQNHVRFPSDPNYLEMTANVSERASPMGQSSNNQSQDSSSNVHNTSWNAHDISGRSLSPPNHLTENKSISQHSLTLGPAAMYPEFGSRPNSARSKPVLPPKPSGEIQNEGQISERNSALHTVQAEIHKNGLYAISRADPNKIGSNSATNQFEVKLTKKPPNRHSDLAGLQGQGLYDIDFDRGRQTHNDLHDSIFDYHGSGSEASSRSVTPPLPPLSPSNSESEESAPSVNYKLNRSSSTSRLTTPKTPDLVKSTTIISAEERNQKSGVSNSFMPSRTDKKHSSGGKTSSNFISNGYHIKESMLSDVRESDSDLPFDIENTILTVDSQDAESQNVHPEDIGVMRQQLNSLEGMYQDLLKTLGADRDHNPARRRWSICSSDTSSLRRPSKRNLKTAAQNHQRHHYHHRDIKAINRRFQRLESHVVTLARSVAHLSSELRSHNSIVNELDSLKKEVHDLKEQQFLSSQRGGVPNVNNNMSDFELFRGWVPSLTNPKRVHKLTKFFGQEPPLLQLFLKKLGYERYSKNFEEEHIGMIELPYMTENRLESIGIPMGPRLRILQEAQLCFRQENFSIYIV